MDIDKYLKESIFTGGYPSDGTGISGDDDLPTGTTVFGEKMVPFLVPNRLTGATKNWKPDGGDWNYDEFANSSGMGSYHGYSDTLDGLDDLLGGRVWRHTTGKAMKLAPTKMGHRKDSEIDQTNMLSKDQNDDFVTPQKTEVSEMDIVSRISRYICEADLTPVDRRSITQAVVGGKSMKINIKNMKLEVKVTDTKNGTVFEYPNNSDFTLALVDISDTVGMEFEQKTKGNITIFTMKG